NKWKFDYTAQWLSSKRIPSTASNPEAFQLAGYSPSFVQMAAQVTKIFNKKWEAYIGSENLTNYIQPHLILDAQNPFGSHFDGAMIWGPVVGRMIYAGMRFTLK